MAFRDKASNDGGGSRKEMPEKLTWKEYEKHLAKLHVELVKLQEWIKHKGLKVFERIGRQVPRATLGHSCGTGSADQRHYCPGDRANGSAKQILTHAK